MTPRRGGCCPLLLLFSLVGLLAASAQEPDAAGPSTTAAAEKAGICPQEELETPDGNCTEECHSDARCEGIQKCCPTGCGTSCRIPDGAVIFLKDPCSAYKPVSGRAGTSVLELFRKRLIYDLCNMVKLGKRIKTVKFYWRKKEKPGSCPNVNVPIPPLGLCRNTCDKDSKCPETKKCCKNGCGFMTCSKPTG